MTPVEVVIHEVPVQPENDDEGSVPCSPFQSMMPRGPRGFHSPKRIVEEFFVTLVLKFVDTTKGGLDTTKPEQLEAHQEEIFPIEISEHKRVSEFYSQTIKVSERNIEEEVPVG